MKPAAVLVICALISIALTSVAAPPTAAAAQPFEGCLGKGVSPPLEAYFPDLTNGFEIVSDERRDAEQLAATFPDPADALSRLRAWCWLGQVERVYNRGWLTVDISIHEFSGVDGVNLAMQWFMQQRAAQLGLQRDPSRSPLQTPDDRTVVPAALFNESEYTLYYGRGDTVVRITVSGERSANEADRDVVAYDVMDLMLLGPNTSGAG